MVKPKDNVNDELIHTDHADKDKLSLALTRNVLLFKVKTNQDFSRVFKFSNDLESKLRLKVQMFIVEKVNALMVLCDELEAALGMSKVAQMKCMASSFRELFEVDLNEAEV